MKVQDNLEVDGKIEAKPAETSNEVIIKVQLDTAISTVQENTNIIKFDKNYIKYTIDTPFEPTIIPEVVLELDLTGAVLDKSVQIYHTGEIPFDGNIAINYQNKEVYDPSIVNLIIFNYKSDDDITAVVVNNATIELPTSSTQTIRNSDGNDITVPLLVEYGEGFTVVELPNNTGYKVVLKSEPEPDSIIKINSPQNGAIIDNGDLLSFSIDSDALDIVEPLDDFETEEDEVNLSFGLIENTNAPVTPAIFTQTVNAMQGAVTQTGFTVGAKFDRFNKPVKLEVYSDSARTQKVSESSTVNTDLLRNAKFSVNNLTADTKYYWAIISNNTQCSKQGEFKTLPSGNTSFNLIVSSCAHGDEGGANDGFSNHEVFEHLMDNYTNAKLFWHLGDFHYQDINVGDVVLYDNAYDGILRQERQQNLYLKIPLMYMWDDHDFGNNDSNASSPSRVQAIQSYKQRIPHYPLAFTGTTEPICHKIAIGRVLLINLDCRSQKNPPTTILGSAQKQWLKDTLLNATEEAFIINTGFPWIDDDPTPIDTWSAASAERQELMDFFSTNNLTNKIVLIAGDAHMCAIDDGTNNVGIPIFQCGALDSPGTTKGGPYNLGEFTGRGQFMFFEITDNGTNITIKGTGKKVDNAVETDLINYTKTITI